MKSTSVESPFFYTTDAELPIPREDLRELMQQVLSRGAPFRFRAKGWSMTPFILDGDIICVSPLDQEQPSVGDVVACVPPNTGTLVVHRVVGRRGAAFTIQGDNTGGCVDVLVPRENILGRVTSVERNGKVIRLGLGPERSLIALFSRMRLLQPLILWLAPFIRPLRRVLF